MPAKMSLAQKIGVDRPTRVKRKRKTSWKAALKRRVRSTARRAAKSAKRSWHSRTGTGTVATARRRKGGGAVVREHTRNGRIVRTHTRRTR